MTLKYHKFQAYLKDNRITYKDVFTQVKNLLSKHFHLL